MLLTMALKLLLASPAAGLPPVGPDYQPSRYIGRVMQITATSVFIRHERLYTEEDYERQPDGICRPVAIYRQNNKLPFHKFQFDPCLFPNLPITKWLGPGGNYYATEVRIGDVVEITRGVQAPGGGDTCTRISILRRPGGKVPPAWGDDDLEEHRRHDARCNAEQFVEEKVIPALPRLVMHMHR
jgi:hypothetical protein